MLESKGTGKACNMPLGGNLQRTMSLAGICPLFLEWSFSELGDASDLQDKLLYLRFVNVDTYTERICWAERNRWTEDHISFYHS